MDRQGKLYYEFGPFRLDPALRLLLRHGEPVQLTPKAVETLLVLVQNGGQVVGKEELMERVWPDAYVEEATLTVNISTVRKTLGQEGQQYIETIPRRGYRFAGGVREVWEQSPHLVVERQARLRIVTEEEEEITPDVTAPAPVPAERAPSTWIPARGLTAPARPHRYRLLVGALVVGLSAALAFWWVSPARQKIKAMPSVRTVAVLPFKVIGGDDDGLGFGMADTLITRLGAVKVINVRPVGAVAKYEGQAQDAAAAGRELNVDAVLEGSVQRADDRVRVTVRLVSVRGGDVLWSGQFYKPFTNLFAVQDAVARDATDALALALTAEQKELLVKHDTENAEAYQAYVRGRYFWNKRSPEGFKKAVGYFQQAISIDPAYARAYAGLADSYTLLGVMGGGIGKEVYPKAKAAALKALEIDDTLGEAHTSLATIKFWYDWDFEGAEREFKRAIELNPNYATAHHWYAFYLATGAGRPEEAIAEIKRAQELDPLSLIISADVGAIYVYAARYDEAIEQYRKTLEMDPSFITAHVLLWRVYARKGVYDEAIAQLQEVYHLSGGKRGPDVELGCFYAVTGRKREAMSEFNELKRFSKQQDVGPIAFAKMYACLGEKDQAFEWLGKAYAEQVNYLINLKTDPNFDNLRSDPRYADLLRRTGFPQVVD